MTDWSKSIYNRKLKFTTPLPDRKFLQFLSKNINILDIGCGYGRTINYLSNFGFTNLTGFDISLDYIKRAMEICPKANLYVSDFKNFNIDKKYELILLMGVIEYIVTDMKQKIFFERISKILSQNGYIFLETFTLDIKLNWKQYLMGFIKTFDFGRFKNSKGFDCHHQSNKKIKKILEKKFVIVSSQKTFYKTWSGNLCEGYSFILKNKHE